jgi:hypothetical protein
MLMPGLDVLLYSFDTRNPAKRAQATRWLDYLWRRGTGLPSQARDAVAVFAQWRPGGMNIDVITRGWFWMDQAQLSHWDSLILASAERRRVRFCQVRISRRIAGSKAFG